MTKISIYQIDDYVTGNDKWIGTDVNTYNKTKNFTPKKVAVYFNENEVIDTSNSIRYRYDTIDISDSRQQGTLSFQTEIGATVPINTITTFILSKDTQGGKDVSNFLNILPTTRVILHKSDDIDIFGIFNITSVVEDLIEPGFFIVTLEFLSGNGSLEEDKDYIISVIDINLGEDIQNLQEVTDEGSTTTNSITIDSLNYYSLISPDAIGTENKTTGSYAFLGADGLLGLKNGTVDSVLKNTDVTNNNVILEFPDKPTGSYTIATTSDVVTQDLQQVTDEGSTTTNSITANSFIKTGGTGNNALLDNGSTIALSSIESATTSPITADLEVGGIADQQVIPTGTNLQEFATLLLSKTYYPILTAPTFALSNNAGTREIGSSSAFTLTFTYNDGDVLGKTVGGIWQPSNSQGGRSGSAISYTINGTTQASNTLSVSPVLLVGGNTLNATVTYGIGIQPLDSKGINYDAPYPAGTSPTRSTTVQGIYPYFWYKSASPITSAGMQAAIANGTATKVIASSTGTITIDFDATGEYLAFAYPSTSTTKTIWYVTALSNGTIPGGVFGGATTLPCNSSTSLWSNVSYKIHVTAGLITESEPMQLRNS